MQLLTALSDRRQVRHVRCHRPFHRIQALCGWFEPVIREQAQLLLEFEWFEAVEEADVLEVRIKAQFHQLVLAHWIIEKLDLFRLDLFDLLGSQHALLGRLWLRICHALARRRRRRPRWPRSSTLLCAFLLLFLFLRACFVHEMLHPRRYALGYHGGRRSVLAEDASSCALLHSSAKRLITFLRFLLQPLELPRGDLTRRVGCLKVGVYHRLQALPRQIESAELLVSFGLAVHDRVVGRVELKNPVTRMASAVPLPVFECRYREAAVRQASCRGDGLVFINVRIDSCHILEYIRNLHKAGNCHCVVVLLKRFLTRLLHLVRQR
mmetsp:Transcript_8193/g.19440  ORF Transcript_8193/g.19440 Transcript_8193/m.19440 type:complete len:323 (-) Transcript_8193:77-1045(-)